MALRNTKSFVLILGIFSAYCRVCFGFNDFSLSEDDIEIFADEVQYSSNKEEIIFIGDVNAKQGKWSLEANTVRLLLCGKNDAKYCGTNKVKHIYMHGCVRIKSDIEGIDGESGEYSVIDKVLKIHGGVVLNQEGNILKGDEFMHDYKSEQSYLKSKVGSGRVQGHIVPKKREVIGGSTKD